VKRTIALRDEARRDIKRFLMFFTVRAGDDLANRFAEASDAAFRLLAELPEMGSKREFENPNLLNIRMRTIGEFPEILVSYQPTPTGIRILRLIHAKEDYWRVLNG